MPKSFKEHLNIVHESSAMLIDYVEELKKIKGFNDFVAAIVKNPSGKDITREIGGPRGEMILYWVPAEGFNAEFGNLDNPGRPLAESQIKRIESYIRSKLKEKSNE